MNNKLRVIGLLSLIFISGFILLIPNGNQTQYKSDNLDEESFQNQIKIANNGEVSDVLVYFNSSSYNTDTIANFTYHGGVVKTEWNNTFSNMSGFAGYIPTTNLSLYQGNISDANIETDEIIEAQMNYASLQTNAVNLNWYYSGLKGNTNSSIAILDTGINPNHEYFSEGFASTNLNGSIVGWEDFINNNPSPSDDNGHGTFIASVIAGTGSDLWNQTTKINLYGNYSHTEIFGSGDTKGNSSIRLMSFNASLENTYIVLNSSWNLLEGQINGFWFDLYYNGSKVDSSFNENPSQKYVLNHSIQQNTGIYDVYLTYYKKLQVFPIFNFTANITYVPESYVANYSYFTGIANSSKIVSYKILNKSGMGYTSDLISALASVIQNRTKYHIVSTCLSVATFGEDFSFINSVIDEVIENGIIVVIAAGNLGTLRGSDPLNRLATNKNAIVVGAINDLDQITVYSSMGKDIGGGVIKPDIVAPGGSSIPEHRSIIAADAYSNKTTVAYGTSIATAIVSAAVNLLIEAKWNDWNQWDNLNNEEWGKIIKSTLLMTASETNLLRENDPNTDVDESDDSPGTYLRPLGSLKDIHEGYGRINIQAAIDALTKVIDINENYTLNGTLISSESNPLGQHVFARRVTLNKSITYTFNLTIDDPIADFDMFLFSNRSDSYGEPILLESARSLFQPTSTQFYFTPSINQTEGILVIKAVSGESNFSLLITNTSNQYSPELTVPEVRDENGVPLKNSTVLSYQEYIGFPKDENYTLDQYLFYIQYSDNDTENAPPADIYVSIVGGENYTLTRAYIDENNFTTGVTYESDPISFNTSGTYEYFFVASDGIYTVRYPESNTLKLTILDPEYREVPYEHTFDATLDGWDLTGTGWNHLIQFNTNDDRSRLYPDLLHPLGWRSIYFGVNPILPQNYTYQPFNPLSPDLNGSVFSPWFNLTGISNPIVKFGIRVSINTFDNIHLYVTYDQWGQEDLLRTYSNEESEWDIDEFNLTKYKGKLIQFRFEAELFALPDYVKDRGFMLDYVSIENYTNNNAPQFTYDGLNWDRVSPPASTGGSRYQQFYFTCEVKDMDGNYPEQVILEFGSNEGQPGSQFEMLNIYGDFDVNSSGFSDNGILFRKAVVVGSISNRSYQFKVYDGKYWVNSSDHLGYWFSESEIVFNNPTPLQFNYEDPESGKDIAYQFANDNLDDYFVAGYPNPREYTAWLAPDNTWHPDTQDGQNVLYCGVVQMSYSAVDFGYGYNWNAELMTRPLYLPGEYPVYFEFSHTINFDTEPNLLIYDWYNNQDKGFISISTDYGNSWTPLGLEYYYNSEDGNVKVDISDYAEEVVMMKFTFDSNQYDGSGLLPGRGWTVYNISIGYDKATDFVAPKIQILNPTDLATISSIITIKLNLTDNRGIDESRFNAYLKSSVGIEESLELTSLRYNNQTGIMTFDLDTSLYTDDTYKLRIVVFDEQGNRAESSITVIIDNGFIDLNKWWPWLLFILIVVIVAFGLYIFQEKKGKYLIQQLKTNKAEKMRLQEIDYQQAKMRIEELTPEEELKRPLILHCKACKSWFYSDKMDIMCPVCGRDQVFAAYNCESCKKWFFFDMPSQDHYCPKCSPHEEVETEGWTLRKKKKIDKKRGIRLVRRELEDVEDLLMEDGKFLREYKFEDKRYSILD